LSATAFAIATPATALPWKFDAALFKTTEPMTLCFDLAASDAPKAGLTIHLPPQATTSQHTIVLPFATTKVEDSKEAYITSGSFDHVTLINFISSGGAPTISAVGFSPMLDVPVEGDLFRSTLPGSLYFFESGLKRRFFYRSEAVRALVKDLPLATVQTDSLNLVAVRLPLRAQVFEPRADAAVPIRAFVLGNGLVRHYSVVPDKAAVVDLEYQVPPTSAQKKAFEYLLKLFGAVLVPFIGLVLLKPTDVGDKAALRRYLLWAGAVIEVLIISALLWWAFRVKNVEGLDQLLEIAVAVIGALATAAVAYFKGGEPAALDR
jgi:hypothetical protein